MSVVDAPYSQPERQRKQRFRCNRSDDLVCEDAR